MIPMHRKYFCGSLGLIFVVITCALLSMWDYPNRTPMVVPSPQWKYKCNQNEHMIVTSSQLEDKCYPNEPTAGVLSIMAEGRLGNHMMYYAVLWSLAKRFSIPCAAVHPDMKHALHQFFPRLTLPVTMACKENLTGVNINTFLDQSEEYLEEVMRKGVEINSWPMRISSFQPYRSDILKEFQFSFDLSSGAQTTLRGLNHTGTFVGVHIRRTDYVQHMNVIFGCKPIGHDRFHKAMDYMREILIDPLFVVTSDDEVWAKTHVVEPNSTDTIWVGQKDNRELDMATLAACNHSIISVGTFGFWCAYLAGGMAVVVDPHCERPYMVTTAAKAAKIPGWIFMDDT